MIVEVDELYTPQGIRENVKLKLGESNKSIWFRSGLHPGFADAHAHPHVIDVGKITRKWRNYIEWIKGRRLRVDEGKLRSDLEACTVLSKLTIALSALSGATLVALTGNFRANIRAFLEMKKSPRIVVTPTIIEKPGWEPLSEVLSVLGLMEKFDLNDMLGIGVFCHSLAFTSERNIKNCFKIAQANGLIMAMHLSEGINELPELSKILQLPPPRSHIVGVHCFEGKGYREKGIKVVHCPMTNLILYGKTLKNIEEIDALGTDWPLLLGGIDKQVKLAFKLHNNYFKVLEKATIGGYKVFKMPFKGDYIFYDKPLHSLFKSMDLKPKYVFVKGHIVVEEGKYQGLSYNEIRKIISFKIKEFIERYS